MTMPDPNLPDGFARVGGEGSSQELVPAKFSDRFVAYFLDTAPFAAGFIATLFIVLVKFQAMPPTGRSVLRLGALWFGLAFLYQFAGNLCGGSVGKSRARRDGNTGQQRRRQTKFHTE